LQLLRFQLRNPSLQFADLFQICLERFNPVIGNGRGPGRIGRGWRPDELASRLPPKRKTWKSEDSRMDIFDAGALVVAFRIKK
jgi:hypothetical protein